MTITIRNKEEQYDIKTNQNNMIREVLQVLIDKGMFSLQDVPDCIYSVRKKCYIKTSQTFGQAGIYQGDMIQVNE